jgi:hypothetical protein
MTVVQKEPVTIGAPIQFLFEGVWNALESRESFSGVKNLIRSSGDLPTFYPQCKDAVAKLNEGLSDDQRCDAAQIIFMCTLYNVYGHMYSKETQGYGLSFDYTNKLASQWLGLLSGWYQYEHRDFDELNPKRLDSSTSSDVRFKFTPAELNNLACWSILADFFSTDASVFFYELRNYASIRISDMMNSRGPVVIQRSTEASMRAANYLDGVLIASNGFFKPYDLTFKNYMSPKFFNEETISVPSLPVDKWLRYFDFITILFTHSVLSELFATGRTQLHLNQTIDSMYFLANLGLFGNTTQEFFKLSRLHINDPVRMLARDYFD